MAQDPPVPEGVWQFMQQRLGYTDEELEKFRANPRNLKILQRAADLSQKTIVFEVIESAGCNIEHQVGDRIFCAAEGYLLSHKCPKKVCAFLLPMISQAVAVIMERMYEGLDPNPLFTRYTCFDVGVGCGGWGRVVLEARVVDRQKATG